MNKPYAIYKNGILVGNLYLETILTIYGKAVRAICEITNTVHVRS